MEHIAFLNITIGSKELSISRTRLDDTLISTNQSSAYIDRLGNGDWDIAFGSQGSCKKWVMILGKNKMTASVWTHREPPEA